METVVMEKAPEVVTKTQLAKELEFGIKNEVVVQNDVKPEINQQADDILEKIMSVPDKDLQQRQKFVEAIQTIGSPIQQKLSQQSQMLKAPMATLMKDAEDGGNVANSLLSLQENVNKINPNRVDFTMSSFRRILSKIPGVGTPLAKWFAQYQAVDSVIQDVIASLKDGRSQLERDNKTLTDDQIRMRELTFELQDYIQFAQVLDQKIETAAASLEATDPERKKFFEEELLFPLKQRIIDLQQQLAVNQQGVIATEVIIRNNKELIIGVSRACNITVTALNTAATLQVALQRQKKVLEGVQAVTDTTNDLIAGTAEQLKTQGTQIQKQAAEATLNIDMLRKAFQDVEAALEDISSFRRNALPEMANSITEMDSLTGDMESAIQKMEKGNKVSEEFVLQLNGSK
jgi:uncharacterized protein YaaN involved in tellurite resistance